MISSLKSREDTCGPADEAATAQATWAGLGGAGGQPGPSQDAQPHIATALVPGHRLTPKCPTLPKHPSSRRKKKIVFVTGPALESERSYENREQWFRNYS